MYFSLNILNVTLTGKLSVYVLDINSLDLKMMMTIDQMCHLINCYTDAEPVSV